MDCFEKKEETFFFDRSHISDKGYNILAEKIAEEINNNLMLPILFWDERYSTIAVEKRMINEGNISRNKRKLHIDKSAATWILEGAIQTLKNINT